MILVIFVAFTLLETCFGAYLLNEAWQDERAARQEGGAPGYLAQASLRSESIRFGQQMCYLVVAGNAVLINQAHTLTHAQIRGVVFILLGQLLLGVNSLSWITTRQTFNRKFRATTLDLAGRLEAMTVERDALREELAALATGQVDSWPASEGHF